MNVNAADMFLNTIRKRFAAMSLNITMLKIANTAKNGFATNIANMFQNIIGNMSAVIINALLHVHLDKYLTTQFKLKRQVSGNLACLFFRI
jgi:hypothetical protein